jgi:hypothetical protein
MASRPTYAQETFALFMSLSADIDVCAEELGHKLKGWSADNALDYLVSRGWVEKVDADRYMTSGAGIQEAARRLVTFGLDDLSQKKSAPKKK